MDDLTKQRIGTVSEAIGAAFKMAMIYGIGPVLACYFGYALVHDVRGKSESTEAMMRAHIEASREIQTALESLVNINLQTCVGAAKNDSAAQRACFSAKYQAPSPQR